jgi:hypothetical protein
VSVSRLSTTPPNKKDPSMDVSPLIRRTYDWGVVDVMTMMQQMGFVPTP